MNTDQELHFPVNRTRIFWRLVVQIVFLIAFSSLFKVMISSPRDDRIVIMILSAVMIAIAVSSVFFAVTMLLGNSPGLVIGPSGILDNTTGTSAGKVPWKNIIRMYVSRYGSVDFLTIEVDNPKSYLRQGNILSRIFKGMNYMFFHTPIHLSAQVLDIGFNEMVETVERYYREYGRSTSNPAQINSA